MAYVSLRTLPPTLRFTGPLARRIALALAGIRSRYHDLRRRRELAGLSMLELKDFGYPAEQAPADLAARSGNPEKLKRPLSPAPTASPPSSETSAIQAMRGKNLAMLSITRRTAPIGAGAAPPVSAIRLVICASSCAARCEISRCNVRPAAPWTSRPNRARRRQGRRAREGG